MRKNTYTPYTLHKTQEPQLHSGPAHFDKSDLTPECTGNGDETDMVNFQMLMNCWQENLKQSLLNWSITIHELSKKNKLHRTS